VKFKLDENLSATLAAQFVSAGHEAHSVLEQALGGANDPRLIEVCQREGRALVTLDLDFANIQRYPPARYCGIMVLRLGTQAPRDGRPRTDERHRCVAARSSERSIVDRRGGPHSYP
jgi:predicted nuclease of predicted toxin-antitoxin system